MYRNLLKSGNVVKHEESRVIDSNTKIAERLQYLAEVLQEVPEDEFSDEFSAGLDAVKVEQLLGDNEEGEKPAAVDTAVFEQMRAEAQNEADEILEKARTEAEQIIAKANEEAENIRRQAEAEGHDEGYNVGHEEAMQLAKQAEEASENRKAELESYYGRKIEELEPMFIDKLTDIYEHVFMIELSDKKELISYLLTNTIRNIEGGKTFLIHVSADDYEYVNEHKEELSQGLPASAVFEVIEDVTLSGSQCFIEADSGIFDCGLGTELSLLKKELTLLSYRAEGT